MKARHADDSSTNLLATVAALVIVTLFSGCGLPPVAGSGRPPTPTPSFRDQARGICAAHAEAIRGLADRLAAEVTEANLVEQGTVVAGLAGVISTELVQLRSILLEPEPSDSEAVSDWFEELDATADAQVRAVSASAEQDVTAFRTAIEASVQHWDAAGTHASAIGLGGCRPAPLEPAS